METYVILRRCGWSSPEELQEAAARATRVGDDEMPQDIRWIRSYVDEIIRVADTIRSRSPDRGSGYGPDVCDWNSRPDSMRSAMSEDSAR